MDEKIEALDLDTQIYDEVVNAISGVTIPGLTPETIAGALGYVPYDAETNSKDFATASEVAGVVQQAVDAIPAQVNADWNATEGAAVILNKPALSAVATSGQYSDLAGIPDIIATACPVGMIYIQYAGQAAPADLFGGTWENVSAAYAGLFFRAEGGAAAEFGSTQTDGAPNITGSFGIPKYEVNVDPTGAFYVSGFGYNNINSSFANQSSPIIGFSAANSNDKYALAEVRSVNSTIRIWKRTA